MIQLQILVELDVRMDGNRDDVILLGKQADVVRYHSLKDEFGPVIKAKNIVRIGNSKLHRGIELEMGLPPVFKLFRVVRKSNIG